VRFLVIAFKSIVTLGWLDKEDARGHTQTTMTSSARVLEPRSPLAVQLLVLGLVILSVIVILPR
jgi:hypothetical protein